MPIEIRGGADAKPSVLAQWGGLNTHADRSAIPENDFAWLENFFPIAPGNLRTLYAEGSTLYTTANPRTIVQLYPYNLGSVAYVALFLDNGSAVQIKVADGSSTTIGAAGTFYSGGALPACSQYQSKFLIIGSDVSANAYWVWDGTSLFGAGTLSPQVTVISGGRNYTSTPTITATGGSGTGATFSATVANGQVTDATCTNGGSGYALGEKVVLSFSGGGSDTEAIATAQVTTAGVVLGAIIVTNPGTGYLTAPTVVITPDTGGTTQATATSTVGGGGVTGVVITNAGAGYFCPPTLTFSGGGGSGATAVATLVGGIGVAGYKLATITVTNPGTGYATPPTVTISAPETPVTPTAIATINAFGQVTGVLVTNAGYGQVGRVGVALSGGSGSGAAASAQMVQGVIGRVDLVNVGSGYNGNPIVTISSPDDPTALYPSTATATAVMDGADNGKLSSITLITRGAGYLKANVDIRGGNNCAHVVANLMPYGIKATAVETYNNQVWTTVDTKMSLTAPNSVSDFATFDGGGSAPATDSFLRRALIGLKQNSGYLYRFADSSVNVITNVSTSAQSITTYNNANVDAQIGTAWRDTICAFDRAIVFANSTGVYALFGGSVNKVSDELDGLFEKASFNTGQAGVTPTAAVMTLFGIRCYALLFTTTDPYSGTLRNILVVWNGKKWFAATQTKTLTLVGLQELDSVFTGWGTDGTRLFKLFQTASTGLTKVAQTRLDGAAEPDQNARIDNIYAVVKNNAGVAANLNIGVDVDATTGTPQAYSAASGRSIVAGNAQAGGASYGTLRGVTMTTTGADLQLVSLERLEIAYSREQ